MSGHDPNCEHDHSKCRRYLGDLSEYVDGTLSDELCRELEEHMETCENCRVVVDTLAKTVTLYHQLPQPDMPSGAKERLLMVLDLKPYAAQPESDSAPEE